MCKFWFWVSICVSLNDIVRNLFHQMMHIARKCDQIQVWCLVEVDIPFRCMQIPIKQHLICNGQSMKPEIKITFCLWHLIDPSSIEHSSACYCYYYYYQTAPEGY